MKRLGFHTLRDKATDTLGDKLSRQLQEDVAPKMSDEEAFSFAEFNAEDAERGGYSDYSYWKSTLRAFFQNKIAVFFLFVMVAVLLFTFIQPYLPGQKDPILIHNDQWGLPLNNIPPSKEFWFGTNSIGQDLWARIWAGTRTSLFIGFSVAFVEAVVGILVGVLWGYVRKLDFFFTELYNVLDNIPQTLLLILISYVLKPGVSTIIFALSLTGWLGMARFIRNPRSSSSATGTTIWPPGVWAFPPGVSSSRTCCPIWCPSSPCAWRLPFPPPSAMRCSSPTSASAFPWTRRLWAI